MGKKNQSLLNFKPKTAPKLSQFNQYADKLYQAKQKNRQKLHQTQQKVLARSGAKGRILKGKKANKFSLLDDPNPEQQFMSHKGKPIKEIQAFNDVQFGEEQEHEDYKQAQSQLQFAGFDDQPKSKNDVYKEIMEKSKMYKKERQDQYEKNYTSAVDLDENYQNLIPSLKFQSKASRFEERMDGRDLDYERLQQELEEDQRVVPQTTQLRKKKQTNRNRAKKAEQLRNLMKEDDEQDIRGWVNDQAQNSNSQQQDAEQEEDQLDQLQLSQEDEEGDDEEDDEDDDQDNQSEQNSSYEYLDIEQGSNEQNQSQQQEIQLSESQPSVKKKKEKKILKQNKERKGKR